METPLPSQPAPLTPLGARTPHTHPGLYAVITGLVIVIIVGTAWVFWPHSAIAPQPIPSSSTMATASASPAQDTTEWKTYGDAALGISFEYPAHWFLSVEGVNVNEPFIVTLESESPNDPDHALSLSNILVEFQIEKLSAGTTLQKYTPLKDEFGNNLNPVNTEVNGYPATVSDNYPNDSKIYRIVHNGVGLWILAPPDDPIVKQILSTLTFTK